MRSRRNPLIWQGPVLVILLLFVAYGAYQLIMNIGDSNNSVQSNPKGNSVEIANLVRQIEVVQSDNALLEKELASANERIEKLEEQLKDIDKITSTLSNPFASGEEVEGENIDRLGIITITPLNVRKEASQNSAKIGALSKGTKVQIIAEEVVNGTTWYRIFSEAYSGWVHGNYVKVE